MPRKLSLTITLIIVLSLLLAACQQTGPGPISVIQAQAPVFDPTATFTPFQAVSSTPRPTRTPTLTLTPTSTLEPCKGQSGRIEPKEETFPTSSLPFQFRVYLPPCFDQDQLSRYPVLYMIHGQTYADDQWERLGIGPAADALINSGKAPPFLIVMPREPDTYADIYLESFSHDVIDSLVPWIDDNYPTCAERACRAIGGLSRGGAWALHLGFMNWELFGAVGLHSTPPFNTDPGLFPIWLQKIPPDQLPRVYMDAGSGDVFLTMSSAFEAEMVKLHVPHEWYIFNGRHEEAYWSAHVADYLAWYTQPWNDLPKNLLTR